MKTGTKITAPIAQMTDRPKQDWTLEDLTNYAAVRADGLRRMAKQTLEELYLFGEALSLIRALKKGEGKKWLQWLSKQPYSNTSAFQAIKFFERVGSLEDLSLLDGMTITEAKIALDVIAPKPVVARPSMKAAPAPAPIAPTKAEIETRSPGASSLAERLMAPSESPSGVHAAEYLGRVGSLLTAAERAGIDSACLELLDEIAETVDRLRGDLELRKAVAA